MKEKGDYELQVQEGRVLGKQVWGRTVSQDIKEQIQYVNHGQGKYCEPRWNEDDMSE